MDAPGGTVRHHKMRRGRYRRPTAWLSAFHATGALVSIAAVVLAAFSRWSPERIKHLSAGVQPDPLMWLSVALMWSAVWLVTGLLINEIRRP